MMSLDEVKSLVELLQRMSVGSFYLVMSIDKDALPMYTEHAINYIKANGYYAMVRTTEFGDEIVITDKVS